MPMMWNAIFWSGIAIGIALRVAIYLASGWTIMDGLISFRFAEQFASGNGLVFNAGERVSGNTSLLYTFVLGVAGWLGASIPLVSRAIGIAADVAAALAIRHAVGAHAAQSSPGLRSAIPLVLFLLPLTFPYAVSGMETSLYLLLIVLLIDRSLHPVDWKYCAVIGLLMFCRPDGVVPIAASMLFRTLWERRLPWTAIGATLVLGVSYLALNFAYYGSVVPNTLLAKAVAYHSTVAENFGYISGRFLGSQLLLAMLLAVQAGTLILLRRSALTVLSSFVSASLLAFLLLSPHLRSWYVVPFLFVSTLVVSLGLAKLYDVWLSRRRFVLEASVALYALAASAATPWLIDTFREIRRAEQATRIDVGEWLRANTPQDARVFVTALEVGYYSKRYTLDVPGLVTPAVWQILQREPGAGPFELADAVDADYVVIPLDPAPPSHYRMIRQFRCDPPSRTRPPYLDYALYERLHPARYRPASR
jgi:hypothetical protein